MPPAGSGLCLCPEQGYSKEEVRTGKCSCLRGAFDLGMHVGSEASLTKVNQSSPEQLRGPGKPRADLYVCR